MLGCMLNFEFGLYNKWDGRVLEVLHAGRRRQCFDCIMLSGNFDSAASLAADSLVVSQITPSLTTATTVMLS